MTTDSSPSSGGTSKSSSASSASSVSAVGPPPSPEVAEKALAALRSESEGETVKILRWFFLWTIFFTILIFATNYFVGLKQIEKTIFKLALRVYTPSELKRYDGSNPYLPLLLALKGHVFDVSSAPQYYAKGNTYNVFVGQDATRAFLTGCFEGGGATHDLRGLTKKQLEQIDDWVKFYMDHETYRHVGYVKSKKIKKNAPLPDDTCGKKDNPDPPVEPLKAETTPGLVWDCDEKSCTAKTATGAEGEKVSERPPGYDTQQQQQNPPLDESIQNQAEENKENKEEKRDEKQTSVASANGSAAGGGNLNSGAKSEVAPAPTPAKSSTPPSQTPVSTPSHSSDL